MLINNWCYSTVRTKYIFSWIVLLVLYCGFAIFICVKMPVEWLIQPRVCHHLRQSTRPTDDSFYPHFLMAIHPNSYTVKSNINTLATLCRFQSVLAMYSSYL